MPKLKYTERKDPWTRAERDSWTPYQAETRRAWLVHRSQARFRHEEYDLTLDEYRALWGELFARRGRHPQDLTMTRCDEVQGWHVRNIQIITREQHCREQINRRHQEGTMKGSK